MAVTRHSADQPAAVIAFAYSEAKPSKPNPAISAIDLRPALKCQLGLKNLAVNSGLIDQQTVLVTQPPITAANRAPTAAAGVSRLASAGRAVGVISWVCALFMI